MFDSGSSFEDEVRRIARQLWPQAEFSGSSMESQRERDGVFITDECVHLLECTMLKTKVKAEEDVKKLSELSQKMRGKHPTKAIKGWFVTLHEPTADQRSTLPKDGTIVGLSFEQFRAQLIDTRSYLEARKSYAFGSMRDLETGANPTGSFKYIQLDIIGAEGDKWETSAITNEMSNGKRFLLLGDYGAGKSTTMREIFFDLEKKHRKKQISRFPILLNLRDHHGQTNPAEALERHARNVGYAKPSHLVRAWLAGYVILLLDGFDEVATAGWSGQAKKLRDIRFRSMQLIREFIRNSPSECAMAISGRQHFFDSIKELHTALEVNSYFRTINLNDFTDEQIKEYVKQKGGGEIIPSWFPTRPLLVGYLVTRGILDEVKTQGDSLTPARGWDILLDRVSRREAAIEAGIDSDTVRQLIERLATKARRDSSGIGPLQQEDIIKTFQEVCGYFPDDRGVVLLQRLPGLGAGKEEDGSRDFIDVAFADAARAGDVVRYIETPFTLELPDVADWQATLEQLGREVAAASCVRRNFTSTKLSTAVQVAFKRGNSSSLVADIINVMEELDVKYLGESVYIHDVLLKECAFGDSGEDFSRITYVNCLFQELELASEATSKELPKFNGCYFGSLEGRISKSDLPDNVFDEACVFDEFGDSSTTNKSIFDLSLPLGARVLLILLKKLYIQRGSGRKDSALYRGMDHRAKRLIPDILQLLQQAGFVLRIAVGTETVWLPVRAMSVRAKRILATPHTSEDTLLRLASGIS